jgi:hypothetical protein
MAKVGEAMTDSTRLAIETLILERCATLKLRRSDLVRRAGFKNVAKDCAGSTSSGPAI